MSRARLAGLLALTLLACMGWHAIQAGESRRGEEHHLLYVAAPGIPDDLAGAGILVFDIDRGHAFVKRISTQASDRKKPENIKGSALG